MSRVRRCAIQTGITVMTMTKKTTTFTAGAQNTLPIWILGNLRLGQQLPQVNVVVFFVIVMTVIPVAIAARLTRDTGILRRR